MTGNRDGTLVVSLPCISIIPMLPTCCEVGVKLLLQITIPAIFVCLKIRCDALTCAEKR